MSQESGVRSQGRIVCLDFVKGVTIFLVVFGHCIQYGNGQEFSSSGDFFNDIVFKIIYSFHMPLFALVSGYLFFWSVSSRTPREVIIRQLNNLILPLLSWSLIMGPVRGMLNIYGGNFQGISFLLWNILRHFLHGLWFLRAMFMASMIVLLAREKFRDSVAFYALVLVILMFAPDKIVSATNVFVYPYFVAGYLWHRKFTNNSFSSSKLLSAGIIVLWCVMLTFYDKASYVYTTGTVLVRYSAGEFLPSQIWIDIFRWLIGFVGCGAILIILRWIKPVKFIAMLGTKSLGIYIIGGYMVRLLPEQGGYIINFAEAVIIVCICYILSVMIKRVNILNKLFFGGR